MCFIPTAVHSILSWWIQGIQYKGYRDTGDTGDTGDTLKGYRNTGDTRDTGGTSDTGIQEYRRYRDT